LTSVLFHLFNAFFIYLLINSLFKRKVVATLVGLLFLVHPVNSIVVDYIASRADSQVTLFILLSCWLFSKSISQIEISKFNRMAYIGSLISFVLALLSKELGIILPFLILVVGSTICKNVSPYKISIVRRTIPYFIILGIYGCLRLTLLNFASPGGGDSPLLYIRLLTTAESFVRLMALLFLPLEIHIEKSLPYSTGLFQPSTFASLIVLITIGIFMAWIRHRSTICFFGLAWFFVAFLPMANIVPINATLTDYWLYLPCFGFFLAIVGGLADLIQRSNVNPHTFSKRIAFSIYVFMIMIFSLLTVKQNTTWHSPLKFYQLALKISPKSYRAHNEIGILYLDQKQYDMAIPEFQKAISLNPQFDQAYDNLGVAYDHKGYLKKAIVQHKKALALNPNNPKTYNNLGNAYNRLNQFDEAIEAYQHVLTLNPHYKVTYNNFGVIYYKRGRYEEARRYWQKALEIDPHFKLAADNLEVLKEREKRSKKPTP